MHFFKNKRSKSLADTKIAAGQHWPSIIDEKLSVQLIKMWGGGGGGRGGGELMTSRAVF
jgi:hypothetical protein